MSVAHVGCCATDMCMRRSAAAAARARVAEGIHRLWSRSVQRT